MKESCDFQPINEFVERRREEWSEHVMRLFAEGLVKISRDIIPARRRSHGCPKIRRSNLISG